MKRRAQAPSSKASKSPKESQPETASEATQLAEEVPKLEVKTAEAPQAVVPAAEPEKKAEDLASQLSKTDSLAAKLELLKADESLSSQEKLKLMQEQLSAKEWNALNGRFNTAKKNNAELATQANSVKRSEWKTLVGSYMLDPTMSDVYQTLTHKVSSNQKISKKEKWVSWTKLHTEWDENEIYAHLSSGRIICKECPETPGVWVYQDTMDFKTEKHLDRGKEFTKHGSEQLKPETKEADEQSWDCSWAAFGNPNSFNDLAVFGSGTSKGYGKVKGAGKHGKKGGKGAKAVEEDPDKEVDPKKLNLLKGSLTKTLQKLGCFSMSAEGKKVKDKVQEAYTSCQGWQVHLETEEWKQGEFSKFSKEVSDKLADYKKTFGF